MRKFVVTALALMLCCSCLTACGCANTGSNPAPTVLPTNGEDTAPPTRATTAPTTAPTTMPTTAPTTMPETMPSTEDGGMSNGPMDDIAGGSKDDSTQSTITGRNRGVGVNPIR